MPAKTRSCFSTMRRYSSSPPVKHFSLACLSLFALAVGPSAALAETNESLPSSVSAFCDYSWGTTTSSISQQIYPRLFVSGGVLTGADSVHETGSAGSGSGALWRLQAGLSYSLADLKEAQALRQRSRAECTLYRHQSELFAFLARYDEPDSLPGIEAKINVLQDALPEAERLLQNVRELLLRQQSTVEEVNAMGLRVAALRSELGGGRAKVAAIARKHHVSAQPVTALMKAYQMAVEEVAQSESRVRLSRRYDLFARAGYDRLFGIRDCIPVSATLTFTFSPGSLVQPKAEEQARYGRSVWATTGVEWIHDRVAIMLSRLRAVLEVQSQRSSETAVLLADLEARYKAVQGVQADSVRAYRDYLWFDLIRLRSDDAYFRAQTEELRSLLPPDGAATQP